MTDLQPTHGGTDALGVPAHDFSTNRNACGPCPEVVEALAAAHVAQYPDPQYTALRARIAGFHGLCPQRVVIGGSASELIHRLTAHARRSAADSVTLPGHHYGDYPHAARLWGLQEQPRASHAAGPGLHWACAPSSPLGLEESIWDLWADPSPAQTWRVLDCAYAPLRLQAGGPSPEQLDRVWQMWTPNKALGMTGIRAAYALAPLASADAELAALRALAPSWVVGAHGVAMLQAWTSPAVQAWLARSRQQLLVWKRAQLALCAELGWTVQPGHQANYFVARWPERYTPAQRRLALERLRAAGIKLRDASSFGLPGQVRLGVLPPDSQAALRAAWLDIQQDLG